MEQSEDIKDLAVALNAFQAALVTVGKDKANPFYKSKYAPLDSIMQASQPVLTKHGLALTQLPSQLDGEPALTSQLMHTSGQWIRSTMKLMLAKQDAQSQGSALTYCRRYSYAAILGIVIDEDDDGNKGSQPPKQAPKPDRVTKDQLATMFGMMKGNGYEDREQTKRILHKFAAVDSLTDLTKTDASKVLDRLYNTGREELDALDGEIAA